jgi:hypothetical protein
LGHFIFGDSEGRFHLWPRGPGFRSWLRYGIPADRG